MTDHPQHPERATPITTEPDRPLAPWMTDLARAVTDDVVVPNEMMWKRIQQQRALLSSGAHVTSMSPRQGWTMRRVAAIAAVLVIGVAIGRFVLPSAAHTSAALDVGTLATNASSNNSMTASGADALSADALGPDALEQTASSSDPVRVAMQEHLVRTVALLTTVRDRDPAAGPGLDVTDWAHDLLGTTRLLIDDPSLRDAHTRRLLQDLELVLMQIIQAHGTGASETRKAPSETMRETNLLPRVRAVVTASANREARTDRGGLE